MRDASFCLLPDFVGCAMVVGLPVGIVGILVGVKIFLRISGIKFTSGSNRSVGAVTGIGVNNVGAIRMQNALALHRNIFRHAQRHGETFGSADHGVGDSGISAGGIEQELCRVRIFRRRRPGSRCSRLRDL